MAERSVEVSVNGVQQRHSIEERITLADLIRESCHLTGTHLGCEHGVCGSCTVLLEGEAVRSCLVFAVQADGHEVTTIEGMRGEECGFCTPGFIVSVTALLERNPTPTDEEIREGLSGNLCRCTGYQGIVDAVRAASGRPPQREAHAEVFID